MSTLKHLMTGMPRMLQPGAPFGAVQPGQGLGLPQMPQQMPGGFPGALARLPALPGGMGMPQGGLPMPMPIPPGATPGRPLPAMPMIAGGRGRPAQPLPPGQRGPGGSVVHELGQGMGITPELRERLQGMADPQYARLFLMAAQRLGRMPRDLKELLAVMYPDSGDD